MINFKGSRFEKEIILTNVYWYLRYSLSYRDLEEMAKDRGLELDHSSIQRWVVKFTPQIEENFRKKKNPVGSSWRMDETYAKVKGKCKVLPEGIVEIFI
jgi:putative transposase